VAQGRIVDKTGGTLPNGFWSSYRWMPHPEFAPYVRRCHGHFETSSLPFRRRELPSGEVALIISLGPDYKLVDPQTGTPLYSLSSFVAGLDEPLAW
jgi:hypothetical protein